MQLSDNKNCIKLRTGIQRRRLTVLGKANVPLPYHSARAFHSESGTIS